MQGCAARLMRASQVPVEQYDIVEPVLSHLPILSRLLRRLRTSEAFKQIMLLQQQEGCGDELKGRHELMSQPYADVQKCARCAAVLIGCSIW